VNDAPGGLGKAAAAVDTLRATASGYSIGFMPANAVTGVYNFSLTKTTTWGGDAAAFWETSAYIRPRESNP